MNLVSENSRTDQVISIIEPSLADLGYELVRVHFGGGNKPMLQIMFDRVDGQEVAIEDCTLASRTISVLLDVADPITEAYELEVGVAGYRSTADPGPRTLPVTLGLRRRSN